MKSFIFENKKYLSLKDFCRTHGLSYSRMRRLCRTYVKARKDPAVAARWMLRPEELDSSKEPKTRAHLRDLRLGNARKVMHKARKVALRHKIVANFA